MSAKRVLVTGGSGFLATHCIVQLLQAGYLVNTTVRNLERETEIRRTLQTAGVEAGDKLSFYAADLTSDAGWLEAVRGCDYVLHVASPFPLNAPKNEDELIVPARDGTLRVLRMARDAGVKRVVMTSSVVAITQGQKPRPAPFTENNWTDLTSKEVTAYAKSKTIAERAAWDFMAREGGALELSVVNPDGIFGPALSTDFAASLQIVQTMMSGRLPALPNLYFGVVDVRDVADLHLRAMEHPKAKGERFLAVGDDMLSAKEFAGLLKAASPEGRKVSTRMIPDWIIKTLALVFPMARQVANDLGVQRIASNQKAKTLLGWKPRTNQQTLEATAESLIRLGLVK